eukprot:TRINITY_DN925_c0_g1_i5.p5 TRINITY_DN925_c0_g1~~TRINITY_DN925_c0_g1_i5.p5  ORF type:complete len:124 (-),score=5.04 TRINITY_DN925_c0_g1_i5:233-604(-)
MLGDFYLGLVQRTRTIKRMMFPISRTYFANPHCRYFSTNQKVLENLSAQSIDKGERERERGAPAYDCALFSTIKGTFFNFLELNRDALQQKQTLFLMFVMMTVFRWTWNVRKKQYGDVCRQVV